MKTTSRKRLLISSVAMLLVAMLALGTATFAWFTQNTSATANEFSAKTVKASELKLSSESIDWTDTLNYGYKDKVLKPVSTVDGKTWFTAVAAKKDSYATTKALAEKVASANVKNFAIVDELNIQNRGGAAVENVKINFTLKETDANDSNTANKYLRIALVKVNSKGDKSDPSYAANFAKSVYAAGADSAEAISSIDVDPIDTATIKASDASKGVTIPVGTLEAFNAKDESKCTAYYNIYAWFEGQDTNCQDAYAGNKMPEVQFSVTGDTAAQQ